MIVEHRGRMPRIHPTATIAPGAIVSGDVVIEAGVRILHGAVLTGEDGEVRVGRETVVLEHALVRGRAGRPARIGEHVMIGPHSHVNGATVHDEAQMPFGGMKASGYGRFGGKAGIDAFTELRWITVETQGGHFPI